MAVAQASEDKTYSGGPTPTPHHAVSVIEVDSILDHVPMDRDEPAPDGFFDWLQTLLPPANDAVVFVVQPGDEADIPHWYNWLLDQHAVWFRETHPDEPVETFGIEMRVVQDEDEGHIVDFTPPAKAKGDAGSKNDRGADDGKVSGASQEKTGNTGSAQAGAGTVQRDTKPAR